MAKLFDPKSQEATEQRRSGGIGVWLRELFRSEPEAVRRQRIEAEAEAELGRITRQPQHADR